MEKLSDADRVDRVMAVLRSLGATSRSAAITATAAVDRANRQQLVDPPLTVYEFRKAMQYARLTGYGHDGQTIICEALQGGWVGQYAEWAGPTDIIRRMIEGKHKVMRQHMTGVADVVDREQAQQFCENLGEDGMRKLVKALPAVASRVAKVLVDFSQRKALPAQSAGRQ